METKISAIIFLVSLLNGFVQPVLPMVEYFVFQENIIEFLCVNRDQPEMNCKGSCYLESQIQKQQDASGNANSHSLINLDEILVLTLTRQYHPSFIIPFQDRSFFENESPYAFQGLVDFFHPPREQ